MITDFPVTILEDELISLANGSICTISGEFEFSLPGGRGDDAWLLASFQGNFKLVGGAATPGSTVDLYCVYSLDGEKFVTTPNVDAITHFAALKVGEFVFSGVGTPYEESLPLTPVDGVGPHAYLSAAKSYKFCVLNGTGRAFDATSCSILITPILPYHRNLS